MSPPTYWIDKDTGKKHRLNGYQRSDRLPAKEKLRQKFAEVMEFKNEADLPKGGVDLRPFMSRVQCQAAIASCTANALSAAYAYLLRGGEETDEDVSRLFIYYNARLKKKIDPVKDSGVSMTFTIEALEEHGACHDEFWPYDTNKVNERPADEAYEQAKNNTITEAFQVGQNLLEMKSCLAQGLPFAFGLTLYESFDQAKVKGVVPMPQLHEPTRKKHPAHAMLAVGYIEKDKVFIVRNSWSENWGDKGYCYIPFNYMTDKVRCYDLWTVRRLKSNDLGRKHWKEDPDWCPCNFSYTEEYHRVETHHYEEDVFQQVTGNGDNDDDDDEEYCSESYNYEEHSFVSEEDSFRKHSVEQHSVEQHSVEQHSFHKHSFHKNSSMNNNEEPDEPLAQENEPEEPWTHDDELEEPNAGADMNPSEPVDEGEQQFDNQWAQNDQFENED